MGGAIHVEEGLVVGGGGGGTFGLVGLRVRFLGGGGACRVGVLVERGDVLKPVVGSLVKLCSVLWGSGVLSSEV